MYALFASIPLVGHLNPLLLQAEELARRGWQVAVASTTEARAHVEGRLPSVRFIDLGPQSVKVGTLQQVESDASADASFLLGGLKMAAWANSNWTVLYDGLVRELTANPPNVMVVDLASMGAMDAADACRVPMVVNNAFILPVLPPALFPPADDVPLLFSRTSVHAMGLPHRLLYPIVRPLWSVLVANTLGREVNRHRRSRNLAPVDFNLRHRKDLILTNSAFGLEYSRPLPPNVHMVGPMLPRDEEPLPADYDRWLGDGLPVVFANLGTVAVPSESQVRKLCAALTSNAFRTLWVLRGKARSYLPSPLPANMRVESWVPSQIGVLRHPNVRVFLSHCGINSAHESIEGETPIVGIPMLADQLDMAIRIRDAGVGLYVDKRRFSVAELSQCIADVLADPKYGLPIPQLKSTFRLGGGVARAADLIAHFALYGLDGSPRGDARNARPRTGAAPAVPTTLATHAPQLVPLPRAS